VAFCGLHWPADLLAGRRPSAATLCGLALGLAGVAIIHGFNGLAARDGLGYACGLASGLCWVGYSLFVQRYSRPLGSAYPAFLAVGALVAFAAQWLVGGWVWPISGQAILAGTVLGVGPYGLAFIARGYLVRNGNPRIVPVLPYLVPAIAAIALVAIGRPQPSMRLAFGCMLVVLACGCAVFFVPKRSRP
jgi:drug/metabolite transporter (DMT)-like permease